MPLKIRVKPEGKFSAGGAVLKNVGKKPADLLVLSDSPVLREDYMMNIDKSGDSDASNIYFLIQVIYLFKGRNQPLDQLVIDTIHSFAKLYPVFGNDTNLILDHLRAGEAFKALKIAQRLLSETQPVSAPLSVTVQSKVEEQHESV